MVKLFRDLVDYLFGPVEVIDKEEADRQTMNKLRITNALKNLRQYEKECMERRKKQKQENEKKYREYL
jgi:hypothetical protein